MHRLPRCCQPTLDGGRQGIFHTPAVPEVAGTGDARFRRVGSGALLCGAADNRRAARMAGDGDEGSCPTWRPPLGRIVSARGRLWW